MDNLTNLMNQNWIGVFVGLIGVALGLLSLIVAYIFYRRSRPQPRLAYESSSDQFPGRTRIPSEEIEITFRGQRVPQITKSLIAIWNSGNTTIDERQMVTADPLRIVTSQESKILDVTILRATREVNRFSAEKNAETTNEINFGFEWLDPGDGALIKILHTGERPLQLIGTIRGVPKGVLDLGLLLEGNPSRIDRIIRPVTFTIVACMMWALGIWAIGTGLKIHTTNRGQAFFSLALGSLLIVVLLSLFGVLLKVLWQQPPKSLRLNEGD